jgi:acylphosphatase
VAPPQDGRLSFTDYTPRTLPAPERPTRYHGRLLTGILVVWKMGKPLQTSDRQRRDVCYEGQVQGVGFRYTAARLAAGFAVTGYVENLADGQVLLVVEGQSAEIERFLAAVGRAMGHAIDSVRQTVTPATGGFDSFRIHH